MTNEMKLITALCEALGFEVEAVLTNGDDVANRVRIDVGSGENLKTYTPIPFEYEYKLTKRETNEDEWLKGLEALPAEARTSLRDGKWKDDPPLRYRWSLEKDCYVDISGDSVK